MAHLLQGRPQDAITWLEKARTAYAQQSREPVYVHAWLASAHALNGDRGPARAELEAAWNRGFRRNLAALRSDDWYANPKVRALAEATYFAGLSKAGMADE
jgi:hypothetical protein